MLFAVNFQIDCSDDEVKKVFPNFLLTFVVNMIIVQNSFKELLRIGFKISCFPSFMNSFSD